MTERNLEAISRRIRALLNKTTDNGATEAEAMAAAIKARELMDAHRLGMSDIEIQAEKVGVEDVRTKFSVVRPVDYCSKGIARYCGVKMWFMGGRPRTVRFLGLKADTEMASWLYAMIDGAIFAETTAWQKDPNSGWRSMSGEEKKRNCKSFEVGMATRINERLIDMAKALEPTAVTATGTALVVVKNALVEDAFAKLGLKFTKAHGISVRDFSSYGLGKAAGERVNLSRPLGSSATKRIGA